MAQQPGFALGLPTFSGSTDSISRFISDFRTFAAFQGWDDTKQVSLLPLCLTGIGRDAYDCLPEPSKKSISLAFAGLRQAFPSRGVVSAQVQLRGLRFDPNSDLDAFAIRLRGLVSAAFPESESDSLLFNYFMQALPMQFQSRLVADGIISFDAALATVRNMCCAARLSVSQSAPVRQVSSETDQLRLRVRELEAKLARLEGHRSVRDEKRTCYCCGGEGHVRRDCRSRNSVCYKCGVKGHLSRVCRTDCTGNMSGTVGSVPPGRSPLHSGGAGSAGHLGNAQWPQTPGGRPPADAVPLQQGMTVPQTHLPPRALQTRPSVARTATE